MMTYRAAVAACERNKNRTHVRALSFGALRPSVTAMPASLRIELVERVLERLGLQDRPDVSLPALADLYERWSRRVPFDNIRKLIHVRANDPRTLPGDTPNEFFEAWLKHGTGATCWAGNGALCELLVAL